MPILASIIDVADSIGLPLLFLFVAMESMGVPVPGETALGTAALVAARGKLNIEEVIAVAAAGAIIGDNIGYLIGRQGGRRLLEADGPFKRQRSKVLLVGIPFFERHGAKAVFLGRWTAGLRIWASWLAGSVRMPWRSFLLWNALGGILWATAFGLVVYELGETAEKAFAAVGIAGAVIVVLAAVGFYVVVHRRRARREEAEYEELARDAEV